MAAARAFAESDEKKLAKRYAKGATLAELAQENGVNPTTVRNALARQEVELRPRGQRPQA